MVWVTTTAGRHRLRAALAATVLALTAACTSASGGPEPECGTPPPGFTARTADTNGTRLHYVIGGHGPAVVLLHGFPETWWTWRDVAPVLARGHTVVAPDLRGYGCSDAAPAGYDTATLADDVHGLVTGLGLGPVAVVGHDVGGWVAFAYARRYPGTTTHLVLSGAALPGVGLEERFLDFRTPGRGLPHLVLLAQPDAPDLLAGHERAYLDGFVASAVMHRSGAVDVYTRSLMRPGRLRAALGPYRELYASADQNRRAGPPLAMPTLALAAPGETAESADDLRRVARDVREVGLPDAGHYVQEERPAEFAAAVAAFVDAD